MNFTDDRYRIYTDNKTVVVATSTYAGKEVKGVARLHPEDAFDFEKGKEIAISKCNKKIAEKRLARANYKRAEAERELKKATKRVDDMGSYLVDAADALYRANVRLVKAINE